jgi:two-component system NtrC family sensor kinase
MPEDPYRFNQPQAKDFPYFRRVWNNVMVTLLAASFIPLIFIGGGMYYYTASLLKQKTLESIRLEVMNHKEAIDRFLEERTMDLKALSMHPGLASLTRPGALETVSQFLRKELPCFTDLGIIDDQGRHLAYVGPYDLISKNYKNAVWFKTVIERGVYISDVFLGYRNAPHFIIAVKQSGNEGSWIIRATVDTVYFDKIVSKAASKSRDAFLIDRNGIFQTSPLIAGKLMGQSEFTGLQRFEGIRLEEVHGKIRATVWLKNVPWLCVVQMDQKEIFTALHSVRNIGIFVFVSGAIIIVLTVLLTTNYLVSRLETKRRSIRHLDQQLRNLSHMASSMEVAHGFLREINDSLANIDVAATWIHDLTRKQNLNEIEESLHQIKHEASRGRKSIERFIRLISPGKPAITEVDVNELLDELLEFLSSEIHFKNIEVTLDYQDPLPTIRSDRFKLRQVFQNLILNAMTAIEKDGEIRLTTRADEDFVMVTVADDGPGIQEENMDKVFEPLFTTKAEGAGLGLPICLDILEKLGGRISIKRDPGEKGAAFIVELPMQFRSSENEKSIT